MHYSADGTFSRKGTVPLRIEGQSPFSQFRLTRTGELGKPALVLAVLVVCGFLGGCAAITNPVANGVSVRHLPEELLAPSKVGEQTILLTMLSQPRPPSYRLAAGDVLGVYVEGILGDHEAASFTSPFEGPFVSSKRVTGYVVDLPAYENDVLHALAQTGGLPGLDAYNAVIIQRNSFHSEPERAALMRQLEGRPPPGAEREDQGSRHAPHQGTAAWASGPFVRIPLRQVPGAPPCFGPEYVVVYTGDVIFLEARDE